MGRAENLVLGITMFMIFDDPMDKYMQIIELGKKNIGIDDNENVCA